VRFRDALAGPGLSAVAEIKRRSPSAGDLSPEADPSVLAPEFERAGAAAVSILVDERFGGSLEDLRAARSAVQLPLLAKGFFSKRAHLEEARRSGADAALLLLRDLDDQQMLELTQVARELQLDVLVEAHDSEELERAVVLGAEVIGINARNLTTFDIDRAAQLKLVAEAPRDRVIVAESGIFSRAQGAAAELAGADAILVGTALMTAGDPAAKLAEVISRPLVKVCGLTRERDVHRAFDAGADMAGFILAKESPRRAEQVFDVPETMLSVSVLVGEYEDHGADLVQLYPRDGDHRGRNGALLRGGEPVAAVLDQPWEDHDPEHLAKASATTGRLMLAGGLGPDNVREAIETVRPWAVDAASRLEASPGIKDRAKVRAFVEAVRS
jgi:indole-3-glycerol phosphate synthase